MSPNEDPFHSTADEEVPAGADRVILAPSEDGQNEGVDAL